MEGITPRRRYYTSSEVGMHNCASDCWLSWLGRVYDLTDLMAEHTGNRLVEPILKAAGTDISHWFDGKTGAPRTCLDPDLGLPVPYTPQGRYLHLPPDGPASDWNNDFGLPWWRNPVRCIGLLSAQTRYIRITNTLTHQEDTLEVATEETLSEILERYIDYNAHARSYTWKRLGRVLDMDLTLHENGIENEEDTFYDLSLPDNYYYPALYLYFNDDLTEA